MLEVAIAVLEELFEDLLEPGVDFEIVLALLDPFINSRQRLIQRLKLLGISLVAKQVIKKALH